MNPKAMSGREANCLHPRSHEPLVHYQHPNEVVLPAEALDTFLDQSAMQNQLIPEEQFTSQTQECIHNQESVISQPGFFHSASRYYETAIFWQHMSPSRANKYSIKVGASISTTSHVSLKQKIQPRV